MGRAIRASRSPTPVSTLWRHKWKATFLSSIVLLAQCLPWGSGTANGLLEQGSARHAEVFKPLDLTERETEADPAGKSISANGPPSLLTRSATVLPARSAIFWEWMAISLAQSPAMDDARVPFLHFSYSDRRLIRYLHFQNTTNVGQASPAVLPGTPGRSLLLRRPWGARASRGITPYSISHAC